VSPKISLVNWYRTREANFQDELSILDRNINVPLLFIQATRDSVLPAHLGKGMPEFIPQLTVEQVNTSHWAILEKPQDVNDILSQWLKMEISYREHESRL
jgi:pimeloyl-ACP methyl ester carboxylesterase